MVDVQGDHYVYQHTFADGSVYIGKGVGNRAYVMGSNRRSDVWTRTARKYGKPQVSFIKSGVCEELALFIEAEAVEVFSQRGYKMRNLAPGGHAPQAGMTGELSPNFGRKHTPEWRAMMSYMSSGENSHRYGVSHGESAKAAISKNTKKTWRNNYDKMSAINKGRKHTPETKKKIGAASLAMPRESREVIRRKITGRKRTPEQIENYKRAGERRRGVRMSDAAREKMSENQWRKDQAVHEFVGPDGQTFCGTRSDFAKVFGFSVNDLFRKDKKRRPHVKGWKLSRGNE